MKVSAIARAFAEALLVGDEIAAELAIREALAAKLGQGRSTTRSSPRRCG